MSQNVIASKDSAPFSLARLEEFYNLPFFELIEKSHATQKTYWPEASVQRCTLLSIKTGGCSEDCAYCSQSAHYQTGLKRESLLPTDEILSAARHAREAGSSRFCMGAAWKGIDEKDPKFPHVLEIVQQVSQLGMEVCVTLGHLTPEAARQLRQAGVTAYNHNIDTSPEYYQQIVTTHTFEDRLETIRAVQGAGMAVCCGGIVGMGETELDRLKMLEVLCQFDPPPESVPINCLIPMPGTPLAETQPIDIFELVRLIAVTRIAIPRARIRLSAGRTRLSREGQALCFFAGANSIFFGDKLLTAPNPRENADNALLEELGLARG